tara:strand:- start:94 stop:1143 length:1050 start_codon:yes stop_codon:yes gene_type:complete
MVIFLSDSEVEQCLDMSSSIEALHTAYNADANGRVVSIPRSDMILPLGPNEAYVYKVMSGIIEDFGVSALRVQSDRIRWEKGRKFKVGMARNNQYVEYVQLYDLETNEPLLIMSDGYASKMRVGATNALGAQYMTSSDIKTMGLLGAGRHAEGQIEAFAEIFDLDQINVYSPTKENREAFAKEWDDKLDPLVVPSNSALGAVSNVDLLACASNSMKPIFDESWIKPQMHVSAIKTPEVPSGAYSRVDRVAVATTQLPAGPHNYVPRFSNFAQRLTKAWTVKEFDISTAQDISSLLSEGNKSVPGETTLFLNNIGIGMQFAAVGKVVYDRAVEQNLGTEVDTNLFLQSVW